MFFQFDLVISQSIYACTLSLQSIYNQSTCYLQLFYCLLTDFMSFYSYFTIDVKLFLQLFGPDGLGRSGRAGRGPGQVGRGSGGLVRRVAGYGYCTVISQNGLNYTVDLRFLQLFYNCFTINLHVFFSCYIV